MDELKKEVESLKEELQTVKETDSSSANAELAVVRGELEEERVKVVGKSCLGKFKLFFETLIYSLSIINQQFI